MITVLDKNTIDQIAAGEVIERPASVVKELVENALDAGADAVTVEIKNGGLDLVRITDNGCGIAENEVKTAFLRHATSKIKSALDLLNVRSLGFRGEALSSIASIARVELLTKTKEAFTGVRYVIEGGDEKEFEEVGCPDGTTFLVRDIFFNTPVRRKFLKSPTTESGYICETVEKLALSHTDISFKLISNGKVILRTTGNGKLSDEFLELYGLDVAKALLTFEKEDGLTGLKVSGAVAKPYVSKGSREYEAFFVNGRFVKSKVLANALEDAFKGYMMGHCFPVAAVYLETPAEFVDVNVHPAKMELRFSDNEAVYRLLYEAVRNTITGKNMIVSNILKDDKDIREEKQQKAASLNMVHIPEPFEKKPVIPNHTEDNKVLVSEKICEDNGDFEHNNSGSMAVEFPEIRLNTGNKSDDTKSVTDEQKPLTFESITGSNDVSKISVENNTEPVVHTVQNTELYEQSELPLDLFNTNTVSKDNRLEFRLIGQVFKTYWLIEMENTLFMIDQHAAHEKVLYEKTMRHFREKDSFMSQSIMPPVVLSFSIREAECLSENIEIFTKFGFELEEFGRGEYKLTGVPAELVDISYEAMFKEILLSVINERNANNPEVMLDRIATISCKAAVKGNNGLSFEEARKLISDMLELENPYHCPHGRPTTISMTKEELEKKFKRLL